MRLENPVGHYLTPSDRHYRLPSAATDWFGPAGLKGLSRSILPPSNFATVRSRAIQS